MREYSLVHDGLFHPLTLCPDYDDFFLNGRLRRQTADIHPERELYGYELLFRPTQCPGIDGCDSSVATMQVLSNSLLSIGFDNVAGGKKVFVNFDRNLLVGGMPAVLPPENLVVEVLESVEPDAEVVAACESLRNAATQSRWMTSSPIRASIPWSRHKLIKVDIRVTGKSGAGSALRTYQKSVENARGEK